MRKKFLSAFLLGALAIATTSTMVSCKDYDDDIKSLKDQLKTLEGVVDQKEQAIKTSIADLQTQINKANEDHATKAALEEAKKALQTAIDANYASLTQKDAELSAAIQKAQAAADAAAAVADKNTVEIQKIASDLATTNEKLNTLSAGLTEANEKIAQLNVALVAQKAELETAIAEGDAATLQKALDAVKALEKKVNDADKALQEKMDEEIGKVNDAIEGLSGSLDDLQSAHNNLAADVKTIVNTTIPALQQDITNLSNEIKAVDAKYEKISLILANKLRSLVFIPNLYVDGIETIEYAFLKDTTLHLSDEIVLKRQRQNENYEKTLRAIYDYVYTPASSQYVYGPAWPVDYHLNPSTSTSAWADVKGWTCREVEVATRAAVKDFGAITSPEKYDDGAQLFKNYGGIVTVGLKIENPLPLLTNGPEGYDEGETGKKSYGKDNIVALQIKSQTNNNADTLITSDYAMLAPEVVHPEAIVWTADNNRGKLGTVDENVSHSYKGVAEKKCPTTDGKTYHIWDTPVEALKHTQGPVDNFGNPDIELPYNSAEGVVLSKMIGTHVEKTCDIKGHSINVTTWKFNEEKKWGLKYIFELVDYTIDGNLTSDSRYCTIDKYTGQIIARDVDAEGKTVADKPATNNNNSVVGREPLVRIRLVDAATESNTFLDAYVLVRITQKVEEQQLTINDYPVYEENFDLCNSISFDATTWAQFDAFILDKLNMSKEQFDAQYEADIDPSTTVDQPNGGKISRAYVFADDKGTPATYTCPATKKKVPFGSVLYFYNEVNTTNDVFLWTLTEDELEYLTHEKEELPVNFKQYIRYKGVNGAQYKYIYVKLEANIGRDKDPETGIKTKINNYWYGLDGNADGWDAVALNINYPNSTSGTPTTWSNTLLSTFKENKVQFTDDNINKLSGVNTINVRKFFFAPINTQITDLHDKTWTITAKSGGADEKWNAFVCHNNICHDIADHNTNQFTPGVLNPEYRKYDADCTVNLHAPKTYTTHKFQVKDGKSDDAANSAILQKCAIDYNDGCFTNDALYAFDGTTYTKIATMNQETGEITLVRESYVPFTVLDMVLNAIGYVDDQHSNISTELHTWVGVVVNNGCGVARDLFTVHGDNNDNYSIFETSWQRPINLVTTDPAPIEDARNNGEIIPVYDHLAFYDWRGPIEGDMEGANKWLWAYYNIHAIKFSLDPKDVLTDMHHTGEFEPLANISKDVHLYAYESWNPVTETGKVCADPYKFENSFSLAPFDHLSANLGLIHYLELNKGLFGYIFYENNGENVNTFTVKVPVEICYEWGHFDTYLVITINSTKGNQNGI